ncbi:MAG TPA: IPT/TIG domain-containing protein [Terriglobia bacterium]|nr:IPT/TIG domain-containing protein [Terriglobia bacterium]
MTLWKKGTKSGRTAGKVHRPASKPLVERVTPQAAIPGGEISIHGKGFIVNGSNRPTVRFGDQSGSLLLSSSSRLVVRVPEGVVSGELTIDTGSGTTAPVTVAVGILLTDSLHPVANPAIDEEGNIFSTFSGSRGQKVPVSVYKITSQHVVKPFVSDMLNPTGLAFDRDGTLFISSRMEGTIYQVTPEGEVSNYAEGMGVATGLAFDELGHLYAGDRTGTIFKISPDRQIFVFATLEPSVSAYHLAMGPEGNLYVTGPTTSSFDSVYSISPDGAVKRFYRGLGRPQGMAFDASGNLYVAASLSGQRGVARITPQGKAELCVSGYNIVGLAFTSRRSMIVATNNSLVELFLGIEGQPLLKPSGK